MFCGGTGDVKVATPELQEVCNRVRGAVEAHLGRELEEYTAKVFRTQVVAGMNYFVKMGLGGGEHAHLRIYRDLQGHITLHGFQGQKSEEDYLEFFEKHLN